MLSGEMVSGRSWCCSVRVGGSLKGGTEMPWPGRASCGMGFGLLGAAGELRGTAELASALPSDCSSVALQCGVICPFQTHFGALPSPCSVFFLPSLVSEGL